MLASSSPYFLRPAIINILLRKRKNRRSANAQLCRGELARSNVDVKMSVLRKRMAQNIRQCFWRGGGGGIILPARLKAARSDVVKSAHWQNVKLLKLALVY